MTTEFFDQVERIQFEGPESDNPLAFRWYDAERVVLGKRMEDHLRFAVAYWHSFNWSGFDIFGDGTLDRPWIGGHGDEMSQARDKMAAAFEFFDKLGVPFFCFHDRDLAPEGATFTESSSRFHEMVELAGSHMQDTGVQLLWGTANLFSNTRYMAGAATNPDPDVFAYAAAQVRDCLEATHKLGGSNYVLWGGRDGYDTLLNTDMGHERTQLARFLHMVVEHKHAIGFDGAILIEPKPFEPVKHQYDFDVAAVHAMLQQFGLEDEIKVNIEVNHATLSGHDFHHEIATAFDAGIFGSIDANSGDDRLGWDLDRFPVSVEQMSFAMYEILRGGGFTTGGLNFDAKLRRQSIDRVDLFKAHVGGMDTMARALIVAADLVEDGAIEQGTRDRYRRWEEPPARAMLTGERSLDDVAKSVIASGIEPQPRSGRQEELEYLVARYVERAR